jgi:hypothetical protein
MSWVHGPLIFNTNWKWRFSPPNPLPHLSLALWLSQLAHPTKPVQYTLKCLIFFCAFNSCFRNLPVTLEPIIHLNLLGCCPCLLSVSHNVPMASTQLLTMCASFSSSLCLAQFSRISAKPLLGLTLHSRQFLRKIMPTPPTANLPDQGPENF